MGEKKQDDAMARYADAKLMDFEEKIDRIAETTVENTTAIFLLSEVVAEIKEDTKDTKEILSLVKEGKVVARWVGYFRKAVIWIAGLISGLGLIYASFKYGLKK